jgi:hypothetical protein
MAKTRAAVVEKEREYIRPPFVVDGEGESLPRRCGRFFQNAYEHDRNHLFLDVLYHPSNAIGKGITSLFVRRSVYFAFFGNLVPHAKVEVPGSPTQSRPGDDMDWETDSRPTARQAPVAESSAQKQARIDRHITSPRSNKEQTAMEHSLMSQASGNVFNNFHLDPGDGNRNIAPHRIFFQVFQRGGLQDQEKSRSYDGPSEVKRVAAKYIRKGMHLMTTRGRGLTPERCFDAVVADRSNTIVLVPAEERDINRLLIASGVGSVDNNQPRRILQPRRMITDR